MAKQEFLAAVEDGHHAQFITLIQNHGSKRSTVDLEEVVIELNRAQHEKIWNSLHSWVNEQLNKLVGVNESEEEVESGQRVAAGDELDDTHKTGHTGPTKIASSAHSQHEPQAMEPCEPYNEKLMEGVLEFAHIYIKSFKDGDIFIPDTLMELAVLLHGMARVFKGRVQAGVASLCELWWLKGLEEREHLVLNVLPILLDVATSKGAKRKDVIRLWSLREALQLVELDDPNYEPFVEQLVACAAAAIFLTCDEGVKWLATLFSSRSLISRLHRKIKTVLPGCTKLQCEKYAEVYFRAWKTSKGDAKVALEEECIQDLMYAAVHVDPTTGRLSANLHHLLHQIHRQKRHHAVATTIYSLYDPFIWRSLKAANGLVRTNAISLLCDAFPLTDSTFTQEEKSDLQERQYQAIITLLVDPCHLARIAAIRGVFNILADYWLMIPSHIIKAIFQKLLSDLVYDASSAEVRTQVIKGLTLLLDFKETVPFLTEVLVRLGDVFDDISANVRVAFVKLLLKVKSSKVIRYWEIVPVHHLLHRLEEDKPVVCKLLTQLLLSSFHPVHREDQELFKRSLALLEENRAAARRFYRYASRKLDLNSTVHFMLLIWRCLRNFILARQNEDSHEESEREDNTSSEDQPDPGDRIYLKGARRASPGDGDSSAIPAANKENTAPRTQGSLSPTTVKTNDSGKDEDSDESSLDNPIIVGGLLDTVVILWTTNAHRLAQQQNLKYLEALRKQLSKSMPLFFKFFKENNDASQTLLFLSSFLPRTLVPTLVGHCLSRLRSLQSDQGNDDLPGTYINALCNWNRSDDILELASEWLEEGFSAGMVASNKERRRSSRRVRFCKTSTPQPLIALRLLQHILQHPFNKLTTIKSNRHLLLEITLNMEKVKDRISDRLDRTEELSPLCSDTFLCECWAQYLRLVAVLHNPSVEEQEHDSNEERDDDGESPETLLFDSSETILLGLDWANSVLVPALGESSSGGKRKLRGGDDASAIAVSALDNLITTSTHLLMTGAANTAFVYKMCTFVDSLLKLDASGSFWQNSLLFAMEAHQFLQSYDHTDDDEEFEDEATPVHVINMCLSSISDYFKVQDNLPKDASKIDDTLVQLLTTLGQGSRQDQSEVMVHMADTVVQHICWIVDKDEGINTAVTKIQDAGGCVGLLIGVCQSRAKLSTMLMDALTHVLTTAIHVSSVKTTAINDITSLLAISYLLKILVHDSGKISKYSMKQTVVAADSIMARIILPTASDDNGIFQQYTRSAKEIIQDLKSSLGVL
nr:condensin-2 complex subunit G2-like isoform X2 [Procambarus clarkii]